MRAEPGASLVDVFRSTAWLIPALWLVRSFESIDYALRYGMPANTLRWLPAAGAADLLLGGAVTTLSALTFLVVRTALGARVAVATVTALAALCVVASALLSLYFCQARIPLGADLFGYSRQDIVTTVRSSSGVGLRSVLELTLLAVAIGALAWRVRRTQPSPRLSVGYLIGALLTGTVYGFAPTALLSSAQDFDHTLAANKLQFFLDSSLHYGEDALAGDRPTAGGMAPQGYPLMKPATQPDVLGPYFRRASAPPNLVVVAVEGLGKAFMPGEHYGGFTPFIESLLPQSLYFPNFLATSGRSFGFLPGFFGSLPPGEAGFTSLGARMPAHDTLISLLRTAGYRSNYFVGIDSSFDGNDVFLERQGTDQILGRANFGPGYRTMDANAEGFSWGYSDADVFRRALTYLAGSAAGPRLDIYHTVNAHESFTVPDTAVWQRTFEAVLARRPGDAATRAEIARNPEVFRALLNVDDALRQMFARYAERKDFERTIFIVTGDHRLIPLPEDSPIDRFRVPLIIWSPLLRHSATIAAVSSHADVTPSLIALLRENYGIRFPAQAHWLGSGIDMSPAFRNTHTIALMRTKNTLNDFLDRDFFLSGDALYRVLPGLELEPSPDASQRARLRAEFDAFKVLNRYVIGHDRIRPAEADPRLAQELRAEQQLYAKLHLESAGPAQLYAAARTLLRDKRFDDARVLGRHVLRDTPNDLDMRLLIGRSFAWQDQYEQARACYEEVIRRGPAYGEAYAALADLALWSSRPADALKTIDAGLAQDPGEPELWLRRGLAQERLRHLPEARAALQELLRLRPTMPEGQALAKRLAAQP
jgi:tetratricopeptide (TPR) repeat protein